MLPNYHSLYRERESYSCISSSGNLCTQKEEERHGCYRSSFVESIHVILELYREQYQDQAESGLLQLPTHHSILGVFSSSYDFEVRCSDAGCHNCVLFRNSIISVLFYYYNCSYYRDVHVHGISFIAAYSGVLEQNSISSAVALIMGCFCLWTFFYNITLNMLPSDSLISNLCYPDIIQGSSRHCN